MSEALHAALAMVEHSRDQAASRVERRITRARRTEDTLANDCALD
jgi:hypothetical protein